MKSKKTTKKTTKKKSLKDTSKADILYLIPIVVAIAVIPLIVYLKTIVLQGIQKDMWTGGDKTADFFSYYKYIWLVLATAAGVISLLIKKMNNGLPLKRAYAYIPLAVYALFVLLSTILSQYKDVATGGFVDRFEGVYALLAYVALAFVTYNLVDTEKHLKYIINALLISSAVLGLIGLSQYLGIDFYGTSIGKHLILPPEYQNMADKLNFKFGKFFVYATLYNPDYVGSYIVLVLPVCIGVFIYEKKIAKKIFTGLLACILFSCLLGSKSMAGLIGLAITAILLVIFFRRIIIKYIKPIAIACAAALILLVGINYFTGGSISQRINNLYRNSTNGQALVYVKDIILKDNTINIITEKQSVLVQLNNGALKFYGDNNEILAVKQDQNVITFEDQKYSIYRFQKSAQGLLDCFIGIKTFQIAVTGTGFKLVGLHGKLIDVVYPEKIGFNQQESVLSARGFIWSRTIPLLKDTILVGHGPDTFPIYFPQDDIVGKLNAYGTSNVLVDKPHNLYLQMAMNTGIPSVLAFLALIVIYVVTSFRMYFKRVIIDYKDYIGISVFCAISGYCVTSLANDSVVSVAPVFWALLGLGMACNLMLKYGSPGFVQKSRVLPGDKAGQKQK